MTCKSHSHSIVSGANKSLNLVDFLAGYAKLTVSSTAKNVRLMTIDAESHFGKAAELAG